MRRAVCSLCVCVLLLFAGACRTPADEDVVAAPAVSPETVEESAAPAPEVVEHLDRDTLEFADLAGVQFRFSSGAGAWHTQVEIGPDGAFSGLFVDTDMGDTGPDYPNGTQYECRFRGAFTQPVKVDDYVFSMQCVELEAEEEAERVEIVDGQRIITAQPYGMDDAGEFLLYLPGKRLRELPEPFLMWVYLGERPVDRQGEEVLSCYGLYNVAAEQGFRSYDPQ